MLKKIFCFALIFYSIFNIVDAQEKGKPIPDTSTKKIEYYTSKFKTILETINKNYDDTVDIEKLSDKCFNAMLSSLDPFSRYFPNTTWKSMLEESKGVSVGVGLTLFAKNDTLAVVHIAENSPAANQNIKTGDKILFIDGKSFIGQSVAAANKVLEGTTNSKVEIIFKQKEGNDLKSVTLERKEFELPSISTHFIIPSEKALYVKMIRFATISPEELKSTIKQYKKSDYNSLIVDLKDNPGGNLDAVINICKEFTAKGDTLLMTKAKNETFKLQFINDKSGEFQSIPLVIIVNSASASASEIFAGVAQDLDRGIIVGESTTGKGLVQKSWTYTDTSAFRITVAKYYTPSGRLIQKPYNIDTNNLISPEMKMNMTTEAYNSLKEILKKNGGQLQVPVYKTRKGRTVLGGGGIYPDINIKADTLTLLTEVLKSRGIFLEFALDYLSQNRSAIEKKFPNRSAFHSGFSISDTLFTDFVKYFRTNKNLWNEAMFATDKQRIRLQLKAVMAYLIWGDQGYYEVLFDMDNQAQTAVKSIPKAMQILE